MYIVAARVPWQNSSDLLYWNANDGSGQNLTANKGLQLSNTMTLNIFYLLHAFQSTSGTATRFQKRGSSLPKEVGTHSPNPEGRTAELAQNRRGDNSPNVRAAYSFSDSTRAIMDRTRWPCHKQ
jgi:hypothetical protein